MYPHAYRVARQRMFRAAPYPLRLTALAVMLSFSILPGHAQEPAVLPPVEVKGSYDESIGTWDAASQGAATKEVIEKRPILRPAEVLENVPGMVVTQHSGDGKANQYFLRGYNLDHGTDFATWVAGMPVNMTTHAHGQGYTDLNFLIPELITRWSTRRGRILPKTVTFLRRAAHGSTTPSGSRTASRLSPAARSGTAARCWPAPRIGAGGRLRSGAAARRRLLGQPRSFSQDERRAALRAGQRGERLRYHRHGLSRRVELDRPDSAARRGLRARSALYGAIDPTDGGRSERYSLSGEWRQSEGGVNRARERLPHRLAAQSLLELHVFPRRPGERRPVRAGREAPPRGRLRQPDLVSEERRAADLEYARRTGAPRSHPAGGPLQKRSAGAARDDAGGRR